MFKVIIMDIYLFLKYFKININVYCTRTTLMQLIKRDKAEDIVEYKISNDIFLKENFCLAIKS